MATGLEDDDFSEAEREEYVKASIERLQALAAWPSEKLALDKRLAAFNSYNETLRQFINRMDLSLFVAAVERTEPQTLAKALENLASLAFEYDAIERAKERAEEMAGDDE